MSTDHHRRTEILQGMLDMVILKTVADEALHGYGIVQRIRLLTGERLRVPQGSLYPALHRLENQALLRSEWAATQTGRDAKFYRLTPKGRRRLDQEINDWRHLASTVAMVLGTT